MYDRGEADKLVATLTIEVEITYDTDPAIDTPDAYEPGYDYLAVREARVADSTIHDRQEITELAKTEGLDAQDIDPDSLLTTAVVQALKDQVESGDEDSVSERVDTARLKTDFEWFDQVKLQAFAAGLEEAADDYQDRADHNTPADIDPDWLRARAGRIRSGLPASGSTVGTAPQDDFEEDLGAPRWVLEAEFGGDR